MSMNGKEASASIQAAPTAHSQEKSRHAMLDLTNSAELSRFVEAQFESVSTNDLQNISFSIRDTQNQCWLGEANGVTNCLVNHFSSTNVIEEISFTHRNSVLSSEFAQTVTAVMFGNLATRHATKLAVSRKLEMIRMGKLVCLEITPIYGASLFLLARQIVISPKKGVME
jgi:hypothetical protein